MNKIAVIGGGVIGMSTALKILEREDKNLSNISVTLITEKSSPNTTGDVSAGLWMPYLLQETPEEHIRKWAKETYNFALNLWKNGQAELAGITLMPVLWLHSEEDAKMPNWMDLTLGFYPINKEDLNKLSQQHNKEYTLGFVFLTFMLEPSKLLPFLENKFVSKNGKVEMRKVEDLESLFEEGYEVVVNCTGMYSEELANDDRMTPIRGQVIRVSAPWQFHVIIDESDDGNYIIPNAECVILGGTHQEGDYNLQVDEKDKEFILTGCIKMVPSLENARIIKHQVGLRPGRSSVRLEKETINLQNVTKGRKKGVVIHNYGHGGSGVTLCQGCATDATILVQQALYEQQQQRHNIISKL